jgi:hypothetical protein
MSAARSAQPGLKAGCAGRPDRTTRRIEQQIHGAAGLMHDGLRFKASAPKHSVTAEWIERSLRSSLPRLVSSAGHPAWIKVGERVMRFRRTTGERLN